MARPTDQRSPRVRKAHDALEELAASGGLRGLPGEGKPLGADPDANAGERWAARHLVRQAQARPQWVELREEIARRRDHATARARAHARWLERRRELVDRLPAERIVAELAATRAADARARAEIAHAVDELNALVRRHNLIVAAPSLHLRLADADVLIASVRTDASRRPR